MVVKFASQNYDFLSSPGVQGYEVMNDITQGLIYRVSKDNNKGRRTFHAKNEVTLLYWEVMTAVADYR